MVPLSLVKLQSQYNSIKVVKIMNLAGTFFIVEKEFHYTVISLIPSSFKESGKKLMLSVYRINERKID